ncbi:hypothetical protein BCL67_11752 [Nesterenkonia sandarakina]|uniref:Uncharacterized protein n=1 Tax=Nesterenkonia sandarakina TaxID=272918 RepID=A0A2T0YDP2_9MICC|nr:hypothetical protein BCL67_11752 [Nesterenkonia sandarakina]
MTQMKPRTPRIPIQPAADEPVGVPTAHAAPATPSAPAKEEALVPLSTRITESARDSIRRTSFETGKTKQEIVNEALANYFARS